MHPTYDEAVRDQEQRDSAQKPFRTQFESCKTLDQLAAAIKKSKKSFDVAPWLSWICDGPGDDKKWTGAKKPDATKQNKLVAIIKELIKGGAELALVDENGRMAPHALATLLGFEELAIKQRIELALLAIAHGANPAERIAYPMWGSETGPCLGYRPTSSALDVALDEAELPGVLAALAPHVKPGALADAYLRHAIAKLRYRPELPEIDAWLAKAGMLDRVVTKLDETTSAALVHFLCEAEVAPAYLERMIERLDVNTALPAAATFMVSIRWGVTPSIRVPAGASALDLVDAILGFVTRSEAAHARKPDEQFRATDAVKIREHATIKRALLLARGANKTAPADQLDLPPALAKTGEQILRLAKLLGAETSPIREAMASVDIAGIGPWSFLRAVVPPFEAELLPEKLDAAPLVQLLSAFTSDRWSTQLRKSELPAERRASAEVAVVFHEADDARMLAVKSGGDTQIWKLERDEVTVLAPSVSDYLSAEIDRWQAR